MKFRLFRSQVVLLASAWLFAAAGLTMSQAQTAASALEILPPLQNGWVRLNATGEPNSVLTLEASADLVIWVPIATFHGNAVGYPDAGATGFSKRFYRASMRTRTAADDWKNQITFPNEAFRSPPASSPDVRWVKFAILTSDPTRVFFQDTAKYPFHYEFATQRLAPFAGLDRAAFDAVSLHPGANQQVVLGTILFPPRPDILEYGIQLVGLEEYSPETVANLLALISATVNAPPGAQPLYIPTWEQFDAASRDEAFFAARGFPVASTDRWLGSNSVYSAGWIIGRLVYVPAADIVNAYTDGRLRPDDILLTDGVPAETPLVAGIISLRPSTPNSHVAILSRSFGIPFVYLPEAGERQRVQQLAGRQVMLRASIVSDQGEIKIVDIEGALTAELRSEILALKAPPLLNIPPKTAYGSLSAPTDNLVPADARFFGGKAANYGLLRRTIPSNSPSAIAFSFDLWDEFLNQTLSTGNTLRAEITQRLARYTSYPPDIAALRNALANIRNLFTGSTNFTPTQQDAIRNALSVFDSGKNIRFRSSTNMEDAENFTGAGLYDSYSGCLCDDLDGDTTGPSCCDPSESNERGVFRAIKKVYASFYNDNAFLERLRHGINEAQVGMALLVHHSFPNEAANGVATMDVTVHSSFTSYAADLVTQVGEVSVSNPEGDALPELVAAHRFSSGISLILKERSTLVPLGAYVLNWEDDYRALMTLLVTIADGYKQLYPAKKRFLLDFEYKKEGSAMVVKQVRPIPLPATTGKVVTFLINEPFSYCVFQGEYGDSFANHRLKSQWDLQTQSLRLTDAGVQQSFYASSRLDYINGSAIATLSGPPSGWPQATYSYAGTTARDSWAIGSGAQRRIFELQTTVIREVSGAKSPLLTHADLSKVAKVTYATPMPTLTYFGQPDTITTESVRLVPWPQLTAGSRLQTRNYSTASGVNLQTSFYWPELPSGLSAGYTAPLVQWVETRITGLTTEPIVLRGYYSQTYRPEHHNFAENFIFEPRLEEGIPPQIVTELSAANIQLLHWKWSPSTSTITALGLDGQLRSFP